MDEYATNLLPSLCIVANADPITIPTIERISNNDNQICDVTNLKRKIPQAPNFRRRPARMMDPNEGAST